MSDIFGDIEGVEAVVDDLLIWAENEDQHNAILKQVLERAQQRNLRFNKEKSQIKKEKINYLGHVLSKDGLQPDPQKVEAIQKMDTPQDKEDLQRFLGMIMYLEKFIPNLSQTAAPLKSLLAKEANWHWGPEQAESFNTLKKLITEAPILK